MTKPTRPAAATGKKRAAKPAPNANTRWLLEKVLPFIDVFAETSDDEIREVALVMGLDIESNRVDPWREQAALLRSSIAWGRDDLASLGGLDYGFA